MDWWLKITILCNFVARIVPSPLVGPVSLSHTPIIVFFYSEYLLHDKMLQVHLIDSVPWP